MNEPARRLITKPHRWARLGVTLLVLAVLTACGSSSRPSQEQWRQQWDAARAVIPPATAVTPPEESTCQQVLADLRELREELLPSPDDLVDREVDAWLEYAEHVFFTCFEGIDVADAYRQLARHEAAVGTALEPVA